ncbi:serine/threonine-protein kinase Sgk2 [Xylaria sp. FL1777]|nr:serine/threonine-protein kinase Sgk2 [Xylaria sp. FL1777]
MAAQSRSQIIKSKPIGNGLNGFLESFNSTCKDLGITPSSQSLDEVGNEGLRKLATNLISALLVLPASLELRSSNGRKTLLDDLSRLVSVVNSDDFDILRILPLLKAVLSKEPDEVIWDKVYDAVTESTPPPRPISSVPQTPWLRNTSSFANSSEHRKYVDDVLKEELGPMYVGIPSFFEAFFGKVAGLKAAATVAFEKCKEGDDPLYREGGGWQGWPEGAQEKDVLNWLAQVIEQLADFAEEHQPASRAQRRPLAQPHKPLQGSTAERKLDVGFVDNPDAGVDSKCRWSHILVPGELKSNPSADIHSKAWLDLGRYAREVLASQDSRRFVLGFTLCGSLMRLWEFDRLGGIASDRFDINQEGQQFVEAVLGFLWMNDEQLGFDPTIITAGDSQYIEIERNNQKERLIIDEVMKRARCIAGRATTCWKAHREGDDSRMPLVIKDSWQYPEREEEGGLLRDATEKGVTNVARHYYHGTVQVGGGDDDIYNNIRKGLDITQAKNYIPEGSMLPPARRISRQGQSSSTASRKRSSDTPLPPSKRTCSSSPTKTGRRTAINRVHRRVIVRDYGKAIYKANSRVALLNAFIGCIEGYHSLYTQANMLQRDVSINNLLINEDDSNPSWDSFLIDFDLAIKEQREGASGARGKTGTRAFMAIGVLRDDEKHSFMHDLESFFWVLFWICVHYDGPGQDIGPTEFEEWNYVGTQKIADLKFALIGDERRFLNRITEVFTPYYRPLIPYVNRLRRLVFPMDKPWENNEDRTLYSRMQEILRDAQMDPEVSGIERES